MRHLRANETAETGKSLGETLGETLERMGEHLSDEGKDMLRRVAVPMAARLKSHEVGRALGLGPGETERRLTRLREELRRCGIDPIVS